MRDTDADWHEIGRKEPWYGVLATGKFLVRNMNADTISEFFASGREDMRPVVETIERLYGAGFKPERALDFGCGVGRLCFAMRDTAKHVTGVDVSHGMIEKAEGLRNEQRLTNVEFLSSLPVGGTFDWINSYIVFQHIPPRRGVVILEDLLSVLRPGEVVSVQVTYFHDNAICSDQSSISETMHSMESAFGCCPKRGQRSRMQCECSTMILAWCLGYSTETGLMKYLRGGQLMVERTVYGSLAEKSRGPTSPPRDGISRLLGFGRGVAPQEIFEGCAA
jgi:hypothetical protein